MTPQKYRALNHRCKWCKYCRLVNPPFHICSSYYKCVVKDKIISDLFFGNKKGYFCTVYKPKELDFEI